MPSHSAVEQGPGIHNTLSGAGGQGTRTQKVEAIVSSAAFDAVRPALEALSLRITVTEVHTCAPQSQRRQFYRGAEYNVLVPKVKLEIIAPSFQLPDVAYALCQLTESELGDVLLYDVGSMPVRDWVRRRASS